MLYYLGLSQIDMMNGDNSFFYQTVYKDKDYDGPFAVEFHGVAVAGK